MLPNIGVGELILILLLVLLLFGAKKLPEVARAIGRSFKSFKEGMKENADSSEPHSCGGGHGHSESEKKEETKV